MAGKEFGGYQNRYGLTFSSRRISAKLQPITTVMRQGSATLESFANELGAGKNSNYNSREQS